MKKTTALLVGLAWLAFAAVPVYADDLVIDMHYVTKAGVGKKIGTVTAKKTPYGTVFAPELSGLSPGLHGFHIHQNASCAAGEKNGRTVPGLAAGGHYDPGATGSHKGPYAEGHLGDLPALYVDRSGKAGHPLLAPRVKLSDLKGRALMIHAQGDNYSDQPKKLGGGGARIACGVVKW
ncbi:MAG: superoxide dismutase [Cu-Zn] SodC [Desulfobacteraceae bacterium]